MHSYLRTIGFYLSNRQEEERLIKQVIEEAEERNICEKDGVRFAEISMEVSDDVGILVRGEYDENDVFHVEHYFPYLRGKNVSTDEPVFVNKRADIEAFTAMCDDFRLGVSLIFYLQNVVDYMKIQGMEEYEQRSYPVTLAGLALQGKVLLPIQKDKKTEKIMSLDMAHRTELISEAKKGNQKAIENLTLDDIDMYNMVSRRIQQEDVYSFVDTTFIPYGSESDSYTVLGIIQGVRKVQNWMTREELYILQLSCNSMEFEICINKKDLLGEPLPGRRFSGIVWMQGNIDFNA